MFLYTFLLLLQVGLGEFEQWPLISVGIVAGLAADTCMRLGLAPWVLGAAIPFSAWSTYFLAFELQTGVGWSPELWAGSILLASLIGGLLGYVTLGTEWNRDSPKSDSIMGT